jgi:hypothetical protein
MIGVKTFFVLLAFAVFVLSCAVYLNLSEREP